MKICVCGKGGSGKSTIVALLADGFKRHGREVVVLDSDESNASLFWMLGLDEPPRPLMDLVGGKKNVQKKMLARFTSGEEEPKMTIWEMEKMPVRDIPADFIKRGGNLKLVATGKIHQSLEGCACPMGTVTREFLKKLQLAPNEIALVDMEAGIEHFGRGVETSVDMVISVVEPSLESISLTKKMMDLTKAAGASFKGAILNKILSYEQKVYVMDKARGFGIPILGIVWFHSKIQASGLEGKALDASITSAEMDNIMRSLLGPAPVTSTR
ncbi:MAG: P-loop NTPase [Thermodesulfobacteriota bacterium]